MISGEITSGDGDEACEQQRVYGEDLGPERLVHSLRGIEDKHGYRK